MNPIFGKVSCSADYGRDTLFIVIGILFFCGIGDLDVLLAGLWLFKV